MVNIDPLPSRPVLGSLLALCSLLLAPAALGQVGDRAPCDMQEELHVVCIPAECPAEPEDYEWLPWNALTLEVPKFDPARGRLWRVKIQSCVAIEGDFCWEYLGEGECPVPYSWQVQAIFDSVPDDDANVPPLGPDFPQFGFVVQHSGSGPYLPAGDGVFDCEGPASGTEHFSEAGCSEVITIKKSSDVELNAFVLDATNPLEPGHVTFLQNSFGVSILTACLPNASTLQTAASFQIEVTYIYCPAPGFGYCFGDPGSGTPCPCGNDNDGSVPGSGCSNGLGLAGARLVGTGAASVSADTLTLITTGQEPNEAGLYFQASDRVNGGAGVPFGDGLRCACGDVVRLQFRFSDEAGTSSTTIPLGVAGGVLAGDTKRYQCWYRNRINPPCGLGVNDFNLSNGYEVVWGL